MGHLFLCQACPCQRTPYLRIAYRHSRTDMDDIIRQQNTVLQGVNCTRELRVTIHSPTLLPMTLVDLPGIVDHPAHVAKQTRELVRRYASDTQRFSMFLVVIPAYISPRISTALSLVQDFGVQNRSISVITMCDTQKPDQIPLPEECLINTETAVALEPHGYVATTNEPPSAQVGEDNHSRLLRQGQKELQWFENEYAPCAEFVDPERLSTAALSKKISLEYDAFVVRTLIPKTVYRLHEEMTSCNVDKIVLGLPASPGDLHGEAHNELLESAQTCVNALLGPCCNTMDDFVSHSLQALEAKLQNCNQIAAIVSLPIQDCNRHLFSTIAHVKTLIVECCSQEVLQSRWDSRVAAELSKNNMAFRLQRFPRYVMALTEALKSCAPCMLGHCWELVAEGLTDIDIPRIFATHVKTRHDFSVQPATGTLFMDVEAIVSTILIRVAGLYVHDPDVAPVVRKVARQVFGGPQQEQEILHDTRTTLQHRLHRLDGAVRSLLQLVDPDDPRVVAELHSGSGTPNLEDLHALIKAVLP